MPKLILQLGSTSIDAWLFSGYGEAHILYLLYQINETGKMVAAIFNAKREINDPPVLAARGLMTCRNWLMRIPIHDRKTPRERTLGK